MISRSPQRNQSLAHAPEAQLAGEFSLRYLLEVVFRRKRVLWVVMVATPLLSLLLSLAIRPSYMSTTMILLGKEEILNPLVRFDMAVAMTDYNRLSSFQKVIYSRPLMEEAIGKLHLDRNLKRDADLDKCVAMMRANTHLIALAADSFQIGCTAREPEMARNMVDTISQLFVEKNLQASRREATAAVDFIQKEVDHYREALERIANQLQDFRTNNNETLRTANSLGGMLSDCRTKSMEAELELKQEQLYEKLYRERLLVEKPLVVSQSLYVQNTPFLRRYQEMQLQMGSLLATREKSHPEVLKLQRELDYINALLREEKEKKEASETQEVRSPVFQEVQSRLEDSRIKSKVLEQKVVELDRRQHALLQMLVREPELTKEEQHLENEVKLTREIYDNLRTKLEQARVTREVEITQQANRFTIIEPARVPLQRYKPDRKKFILGGVAGGISLGFLLVFLLELSDPRLIRPGELARRTGLPLLGALPKLFLGGRMPSRFLGSWQGAAEKCHDRCRQWPLLAWLPRLGAWLGKQMQRCWGAKRFELPSCMAPSLLLTSARLLQDGSHQEPQERSLDDFIERVRHIGIAIRASYSTPNHLVCQVTSTRPGEGRTLLTANLGVVLASDLKKPVLLVDACLESRQLSAHLGHRESPGLGDVLEGRVTLEAALQATDTPNLLLLPAGRSQEYTDIIFCNVTFGRLMEQLRERFAMVLLDSPDLSTQSDGLLIAPHTDGVIMLCRLYDTKRGIIEAALPHLPRDKVLGFVMNHGEYWIPDWIYRWV
jgi:polysaccharide chain length determinant protein (PEP-CTERM system associated)